MLTVTEAADELGLTPIGVRYRLEHGLMQGERVHSRLWLIPREEVERAKVQGRMKPGPRRREREEPAPPGEG